MTNIIESTYYVGLGQPYNTVNQVLNTLKTYIDSGNYQLPPQSSLNDGNINIVLVGNGQFAPITIPDNLTFEIAAQNRYLIITRQEYQSNGQLDTSSLPLITPTAQNGKEISVEDKLIGINIGSNNPNVKIIGLKVSGFVIGLSAGLNSDNLTISRSFFTNSFNTQIYAKDLNGLYLLNNIVLGGQYGIVAKYIKKLRLYHNTVIVDGASALDSKTKAGVILQGERTELNASPSSIYCLGNIVYTIGCPAGIFYEEDLKTNRLVSDYNDWYSQDTIIQLRQDNATTASDSSEVIRSNYKAIDDWRRAGYLGSSTTTLVDQNSISVHPQFIQNISLIGNSQSSILNLGTIDNSSITQKVPSWYTSYDALYIPSDFNEDLISKDCLLNLRQSPFTSIGANDKASINGFFGHDLFTSPLVLDPEKKCDLDPLRVLSSQNMTMSYPTIKAGYFWSHDRPYYLYGKKFASNLGGIARTRFTLPGRLDPSTIKVYVRDNEIKNTDWNAIGQYFYVWHKNYGITSYQDEIQISGRVKRWANNGFAYEDAYYIFKIEDGLTEFVLPKDYQSSGPIIITDDRINYVNPADATRCEFVVSYDFEANESKLKFGLNENLIDNSDFTLLTTGLSPLGWVSPPEIGQTGVYVLGSQYAYFGDYAIGIRVDGSTPSYIISKKIPISEDDSLALTWHARSPIGITGSSGNAPSTLTGYCIVNFYDNYDELMAYQISQPFATVTGEYQRYYLQLGSSDTIVNPNFRGLDSAPLVYVSTGALQIPANSTRCTITISGANNGTNVNAHSFMCIDAIQAEYGNIPTYYHPRPDFVGMTVEFETDPSGMFIDTRMNISSTVNENPNGFLAIQDMPAYLWGGPNNPEVTTLHEHRWQFGRINVLPWARLFGKDKLKEKVIGDDNPAYTKDVIVPFVHPRAAAEAIITPSRVAANQDSEDQEYFHIQVLDKYGNPYGLRNFVAHIYEKNSHFPGWLGKRYYGAKEQLGTTIYGKLNSNGSFSASYTSPSSRHVSWIGEVPKPISGDLGNISSIRTSYECSIESNGNITIIGQSGKFHETSSSMELIDDYLTKANSNGTYIALDYPPVFGTVKLSIDNEEFKETIEVPQSKEFSVDYLAAKLILPVGVSAGNTATVAYKARYAYPDYQDTNKIILHNDQIFGSYKGPIQVDYDAEVKLEVRVADPLDREFVATFSVVLQNPQLGYVKENISKFEF